MEENDTLTYQVKRSPQNQEKTLDQSLISQERTQKLDLLMHLLTNLAQSLVVCGPDGIGKTTLLKVLQERKISSWLYCQIQGSSELSFEKIQEQIVDVLNRDKPKSDRSFSTSKGQNESQNKKIILMIDDAGDLVPGLITTLIHYAAANPLIRLIFVLTHDDLSLKNRTDRIIEDCHFVEIPPLSEKQCGVFLHHLAKMPFAQITYNSISDSLIENIYRETHGIPGRIITRLPDLAKTRHGQNPTLILTLAVIGLVAIAFAVQWFSASNTAEKDKPMPTKADRKLGIIEPASSQPKLSLKSQPLLLSEQYSQENSSEIMTRQQPVDKSHLELNKSDSVINSPVATGAPVADPNKSEKAAEADNKSQPQESEGPLLTNNALSPENSKTEQPLLTAGANNEIASEEEGLQESDSFETGVDWINSQPSESFTLQIMVLSKEQAIKDILEKHQGLGRALTYIKTVSSNGREKFLLLYGSYVSANLAYKARQSLPPEFRKAYARKFSSIKNKAETIR